MSLSISLEACFHTLKLPSKFCPQKSVIFRLPNYSDPQETKYLRNNVFESKDTKHIANQEGYFKQQKQLIELKIKQSSYLIWRFFCLTIY